MNLTLLRDTRTSETTTGTLAIDGEVLYCTLEDFDRGLSSTDALAHIKKVKVPGKTCIPYGRYPVKKRWSEAHGRNVYWILDVPGFQFIEFHSGNWGKDTKGCVLLGTKRAVDFVGNSRAAVKDFEARLDAATDDIYVDIVRG